MKSELAFESVHVELTWYDGPREGVANVLGIPSRFKSLFDESEDECLGTYYIWPIGNESFTLEIESWNIFVAWNNQYERGEVIAESHPGHEGISPRYDEIEKLLREERNTPPDNCTRATAEFMRLERDSRYGTNGPDYMLRWSLLDSTQSYNAT